MTKTVTIQDAEGHLGELIDLAAQGEEIVIAKDEQAKAKLVPVPAKKYQHRRFGRYAGKVWMSDDFDAPLPDAFWLGTNA